MYQLKVIIIYILVLAGVSFFNPNGTINPTLHKYILYSVIIIALLIALISQKSRHYKYPKILYFTLVIGIFISCFIATNYHVQSLKTSIIATLYYLLPYLSLLILFRFDIPSYKIEKLVIRFAIAGMCVWVLNFIFFPQIIFGSMEENIDMSRGMMRLKVPFIELVVLLVFYCINKWIVTDHQKYIIGAVIAYLFVIFTLTRQYILFTTILAILSIIRKASWIKKIFVITAIILFSHFILPHIPLYKNMMEFTKVQLQSNEKDDDIRVKAWKFYTIENQTNDLTYLLGNGVPSFTSSWGAEFENETTSNGFYAVDVSWAGFYWYFGIFSTGSLVLLLLNAAIRRKHPHKEYLSYWFLYIIMISFMSGPILYANEIISIMIGLYLVYNTNNNEYGRNSYIKLQQLARHY